MTDKENREKILAYLHEMFKEAPSFTISTDEIALRLGITHLDAKRALIYLHEKGLIDSFQDENYRWHQKINAYGIDEVEELEDDNNSHEVLDLPILKEDFQNALRVFISHKFVKEDQKLALELQKLLLDNHINGYMAERKREYELLIGDKIKREIERSDYLVAILTKNALGSPSVNEEIGYALGKNVHVLLLLEKDMNSGVLSHGREPEYFIHSNFEIPFKNIVDHVVKNGKRKKIKEEELKQLIQHVYEPCYNALKNDLDRSGFAVNYPTNPWRDSLTHAWRLRTEPEMVSLFEQYSKELDKWKVIEVDFEGKFHDKEKTLSNMIKPAFEKCEMIKENGNIQLGLQELDPKGWLFNCRYGIFNPAIKNEEELYQILKNEAVRYYGKKYAEYLDNWKNEKPEIFTEICRLIPDLTKELGSYTYQEINAQREALKLRLEDLIFALEAKLKISD